MNNGVVLSVSDHRRVARFVHQEAGIQLPEHKRSLIEARLRKRLKVTGHSSFSEYLDFALNEAERAGEQVHLVDAITTNKTDFFREPDHFSFLSHYVQETLAPQRQAGWQRPLSVWSAACSTGEEPYTLAIVMQELQQQLDGFRFEILATDISPSVLETARRGVYPESRIDPVPMALRKRYLLRSRAHNAGVVKMGPELRRAVSFRPFNLIAGDYPGNPTYDVIFCRNVMIYFNNEDRSRIISKLRNTLRPGGLLFIGHSESIGDQRQGFETLRPTVYRRLD